MFVALVPGLCSRALDRDGALSVELSLSTVGLFAAVGSAALGASTLSGRSPDVGVFSPPVDRRSVALGRLAGATAAAFAAAAGLLVATGLSLWAAGHLGSLGPLSGLAAVTSVAATVLASVGIGSLAGATLSGRAGPAVAALLAATLLGLPWASPALVARDVARGHPLGPAHLALGLVASAALGIGLALVAASLRSSPRRN